MLALYEEETGVEYRHGIVCQAETKVGIEFPAIFKPDPANAQMIWLWNRWDHHWESIRSVLRDEDISFDGKAIDLESDSYADDPRYAGIDPNPQEGELEDAGTKVRLVVLNRPAEKQGEEESDGRQKFAGGCTTIQERLPEEHGSIQQGKRRRYR